MSLKEFNIFFDIFQLKLILGDLLESDCEAIVNSSNLDLDFSIGFSKQLKDKGGLEIETELKNILKGSEPKYTDIYSTNSGSLKFKQIFHCITPIFKIDDFNSNLINCVLKILNLAKKKKIKSVAFPALSCGWGSCPIKLCCELMLKAFNEFRISSQNNDVLIMECIEIRVIDNNVFDEFALQFLKIKVDPKKQILKSQFDFKDEKIKSLIDENKLKDIKYKKLNQNLTNLSVYSPPKVNINYDSINKCGNHQNELIYFWCPKCEFDKFYCKLCMDDHLSHKFLIISPVLKNLYYFLSFLGNGANAIVFRVVNISNKKEYALKIIDKIKSEDLEINKEINFTNELIHKNIIRYYDTLWISSENILVIIMEIADCSLDKISRREIWENLNYLIQITKGLEFLHEKNIIHLDLKRRNVLKTRNNIIKLTDFGEIRIIKENHKKHETVHLIGTEIYMAPEMFSHSKKQLDIKADIFSLGILFHELLTGKHPFNIDSDNDKDSIKQNIVEGNFIIEKKLAGSGFDLIIHDCLNPNPKKRPSATEVKERLKSNINFKIQI